MILATYAVLALAGLLFSYRTLRGPTLSDRIVGIDGALVVGMALVLVHAADSGRGSYLPVAVVLALVSFISTSLVARFVETTGAGDADRAGTGERR